jgi:hypothetical protein
MTKKDPLNVDAAKSKGQTSGIDRIESAPAHAPVEKGWLSVLQKFNPLGPVAEAYGRTLSYRLECKRIDAELERVRTQAAVVHDAIDKSFQLSMEDLTQRRLAINRFFDTVQSELGQHHLERMTVLKMAERVTDHMLSPGLSLEERRNCKELAAELTSQIPIFGDKANQSLQTLLNALPQVKLPDQLLLPS